VRARLTIGLLLATVVVSLPVRGQDPVAPTTQDCQTCHDDAALVRSSGTSVAIAGKAFADSVHGALACVDCHRDLASQTEWPHPEKLAKVSCASCHEELVAKYEKGALVGEPLLYRPDSELFRLLRPPQPPVVLAIEKRR
jgi:hypothetical protein